MKNMTLGTITAICNGSFYGDPMQKDKTIEGVVIDSRQVREGYLFIAIPGERVDGHDFISEVFDSGAMAVISEKRLDNVNDPYIVVESSTTAMAKLASFYRSQLNIPIVGITGSVGKTSTKEMIASVLKENFQVHKTSGNFNNEIGLPLTIFGIREEHEVAVLEMGISNFGEMTRLSEIASPNIVVITNIGYSHLEFLHDRDGVLKAKSEIFAHMDPDGTVILNGDDDKLRQIKETPSRETVFYGLKEGNAFVSDIENKGMGGMSMTMHLFDETAKIQIPIPGKHNIYNALAAACVGNALGMSMDAIAHGISLVRTLTGRNNILKLQAMTVMDDCYNANPVSMKAAIDVLAYSEGRTIAILGDMAELGDNSMEHHYEIGCYLEESKIDLLLCTGNYALEYVRGMEESLLMDRKENEKKCSHFQTKEHLIRALHSIILPGDCILVKASHSMGFEDIVSFLKAMEIN
ncbi:MAG: UDP-N-acetylmuramoyl-tripeptide--D-alanyl-D-alanine ligase [Lachnospiraceae bacterium]